MCDKFIYNDKIVSSLSKLLEHSISTHSRIISVRFDLRFPKLYTGDTSNTPISRCMARIIQRLSRKNTASYYMWVREQVSSEHPHYHCVIFVNGHMSQNSYKVLSLAEKEWQRAIKSNVKGLTHHCTTKYDGTPQLNGIMMRKYSKDYADNINEVAIQLSYLAKAVGKGAPLDGVRDFGMSRLK